MSSLDLSAVAWPAKRLGEGIEALARMSRLRGRSLWVPSPPIEVQQGYREALDRWFKAVGTRIELEIERVESKYAQLEDLIERGAPLIMQLPQTPPAFLLLVRSRRGGVTVMTPDLQLLKVPASAVRAALCSHWEAPVLGRIEEVLEEAKVPKRRRQRARSALLKEFIGSVNLEHFWVMSTPPASSFWLQLRQAQIVGRLGVTGISHIAQSLLTLGAWWLIGRGALQGRLDMGWLIGWALLLITTIPFQMLTFWHQGRFLVSTGGLLKRRLLAGLLRLDSEEVRTLGAGQFLGRVVESEAVEALLLTGGYQTLLSFPDLILAAMVLAAGAGGVAHAAMLLVWTLLAVAASVLLYRFRDRWTWTRLEMTHDLVERMVGHRTRIVQQPAHHWHDGEDVLLDAYFDESRRLDLLGPVFAAIPAGWRVIGVLGLAAPFVRGGASLAGVAVSLGGILLAQGALSKLAGGLNAIVGAAVAWKRVGPIFKAATRPQVLGTPDVQASLPTTEPGEILIDTRDLSFRYPSRALPVLNSINLQISQGDRLLLTGPSGGGKSTLAALLAGIRIQGSGLMLLRGFDLETLGSETWRNMVAAAPQFHENHVLAETFAFNLLMGRGWPPTPEETALAREICTELGLGEVLERMPSGLLQVVGDTGWQLSHGERSRLYVARALLQGAEMIILDESFGALDPENLQRAIACAQRRARTLLVIAHP